MGRRKKVVSEETKNAMEAIKRISKSDPYYWDKKEAITVAQNCHYKKVRPSVYLDILNSKNGIQIDNILITCRRAS
jgi:hypothetical protein